MEEEKKVKVSYTFYLPDHESDLTMHQNAYKYFSALHDIYSECRRVWKYDEDVSEETIEFAEKIGSMANEAGIWDVE